MTTGRINQVDIFQKILEIELTISNVNASARLTHPPNTQRQQVSQTHFCYHLPIQVVLPYRKINSIEKPSRFDTTTL